ncbi:MAG: response regulator transcription factor [Nitrospira sp.]|nr:response regulator transcription factor [Nitrospira sp.]
MTKIPTKTTRARIIIADDCRAVLDAVATMLASDFDIVGTARDGGDLLDAAARLNPDVIVLDLSMPVYNGLQVARRLREEHSLAKVVFLTVHGDKDFVHEALASGASAYILKSSMAVELGHAIHEALAGRTYVSPRIAFTDSNTSS